MKLIIILTLLFSITNNRLLKAQCNESLVDKAIEKSGIDAIFVRDFKIKQLKKKSLRSNNVKHFDIRLKKGLTYRFNVQNAKEYEGKAILQLYLKNLLLASTYDIENKKDEKTFDFICNETSKYQLLMSFKEAKKGCAVGIMSVVMHDTLTVADIIDSNKGTNILYTDIDNFLNIAVSDIPNGKIEVSISRGTIKKENGLYKVRVDKPGVVNIKVIAKDKNGNITETVKETFDVRLPNMPKIFINGYSGGLVQKKDIIKQNPKLNLSNSQYKIIEFTVTKTQFGVGYTEKHSNVLNYSQIKLIKSLKNGNTFFIKNIIIESESGITHKLNPVGFIIREDNNDRNNGF